MPGLITNKGLRSPILVVAIAGTEHSADICISALHFLVVSPLLLFKGQERARLFQLLNLATVCNETASRTSSHLFTPRVWGVQLHCRWHARQPSTLWSLIAYKLKLLRVQANSTDQQAGLIWRL
jgi:hypothetical protein